MYILQKKDKPRTAVQSIGPQTKSCFGWTPPTWQTLERPNSGPSTCSLETFRNTFALYQTRVLANILHTSPLFQILSKTLQPNSIKNGDRKRRIL